MGRSSRPLIGERAPDVQPIAVRVGDAARITGLCRSKIFQLIASGELDAVKIGKARIVFVDSLNAFLRARANKQKEMAGLSRDGYGSDRRSD